MNFISKRINQIFYLFGIVFIVLIWMLLNLTYNSFLFPSVKDVVIDFFRLLSNGSTWLLLLKTLLKLLFAISISYILAFIDAIMSFKFNYFRSFIRPLISIIRTIPVACIIVLLILVLGKIAPIAIVILVLFPLLYEQILVSFDSIDKDIIEETKMISNGGIYVFGKIFIPIIFPQLFSSLISSFGLGLKILIMAELLSIGGDTIGSYINLAKMDFDIIRVFSWSIFIVIIVLIIEGLIKFINRKVIKK